MTDQSPRLLVVDDAPFILEIIRHIAARNGFHIVGEAIDGQEAVELALQLKPDVILMDLIMPKKSGVEATIEILAALPETRIVAFSTVDQDSMVLRAIEAGCSSFIVKPFQEEQIVSALQKVLALKKN